MTSKGIRWRGEVLDGLSEVRVLLLDLLCAREVNCDVDGEGACRGVCESGSRSDVHEFTKAGRDLAPTRSFQPL